MKGGKQGGTKDEKAGRWGKGRMTTGEEATASLPWIWIWLEEFSRERGGTYSFGIFITGRVFTIDSTSLYYKIDTKGHLRISPFKNIFI